MKPKISLVTLGVRDLATSRRFYTALGWTPDTEADDAPVVFYALEGAWLSLFPRDALAADAEVAADGSGFRGITLAHNEPSREAVDAVFAEAVAAGGTSVKQPQPTEWGGYSGYVADPDGFLWEFAYNPFTDLT